MPAAVFPLEALPRQGGWSAKVAGVAGRKLPGQLFVMFPGDNRSPTGWQPHRLAQTGREVSHLFPSPPLATGFPDLYHFPEADVRRWVVDDAGTAAPAALTPRTAAKTPRSAVKRSQLSSPTAPMGSHEALDGPAGYHLRSGRQAATTATPRRTAQKRKAADGDGRQVTSTQEAAAASHASESAAEAEAAGMCRPAVRQLNGPQQEGTQQEAAQGRAAKRMRGGGGMVKAATVAAEVAAEVVRVGAAVAGTYVLLENVVRLLGLG